MGPASSHRFSGWPARLRRFKPVVAVTPTLVRVVGMGGALYCTEFFGEQFVEEITMGVVFERSFASGHSLAVVDLGKAK